MRDLRRYPVTIDEKLALLSNIYDENKREQDKNLICGDMTLVILSEIIDDVKKSKSPLVRYIGHAA